MKTPQDLYQFLEKLELKTKRYSHKPVFTVAEAEKECGHIPGGHCKNLFLKDTQDRLWLIVLLDSTKIDLKKTAQKLGTKHFSFVKQEQLLQYLGVQPGAVTPFGVINDTNHAVTVVLESALFNHDVINFHPLTNDATVSISPNDLRKFLAGCGNTVIEFDIEAL